MPASSIRATSQPHLDGTLAMHPVVSGRDLKSSIPDEVRLLQEIRCANREPESRPSFPMSFPDRTALFLKLAVLLLLPSAHLYSQAAARTKSIEGLWGAELRLGMP